MGDKKVCLDTEFLNSGDTGGANAANYSAQLNWEALFKLEKKLLGLKDEERPTALCLSGGGVRSAITCMGVIDVLAREKVLERLDYLSTVSGGGYAGVALSTWLHDFWHARQSADDSQAIPSDHIPGEGSAETSKVASTEVPNGMGAAEEKSADNEPKETPVEKDPTARPILPAYAVPFASDLTEDELKQWEEKEQDWLDVHAAADKKKEAKKKNRGSGEAEELSDKERRKKIQDENKAYIRHARANVGYLTPQGVSSVFVGLYVVVRAIMLNLFIWTGLLAGLFYVLINKDKPDNAHDAVGLWAAISRIWDSLIEVMVLPGLFGVALWITVGVIAVIPVAMILYSVSTYVFALFATMREWGGEENALEEQPIMRASYRLRRWSDLAMGYVITVGCICGLFGGIALLAGNLEVVAALFDPPKDTSDQAAQPKAQATFFGAVATLFGLCVSVFTFFRGRLGKDSGGRMALLLIVGSAVFVAGIAVLAYLLAETQYVVPVFWAALFLAFFVSINDISLGRYYRDRLIEAFVPDRQAINTSDVLARVLLKSHKGDKLRLHEMRTKTNCQRPLHIVNTNLSCHWSEDTRARRRNGDNFILSPIGTGSDITGWRPTKKVAEGRLTLATAMAASGAAVNPGVGFAGAGTTTQRLVSLAMSLLSIRLGYWLRWRGGGYGTIANRFGNHLNPPLYHALMGRRRFIKRHGANPVPSFLELSDGANFDNLGLYEMIRRRARVIVVCDAGDDRETSYAAFTSLIRRAKEDFGAQIEINMERDLAPREANVTTMVDTGPQDLVPRTAAKQYPKGVEFAEKGYFLASVTYGDNPLDDGSDGYRASDVQKGEKKERGLIIYLKSALIPSVSITTKGYRGANPNFPFDTTANQFFSAEQFEAYRDMGRAIARQMVHDLHLDGDNKLETVFAPDERSIKTDSTLMENPAFRRKHALK
ncbi:MAG: hypothetical protein AAF252_08135 [Pseudomonadota bacterium]